MLAIKALAKTQYQVTGAPGRGDYVLKLKAAARRACGVAGADRLWFFVGARQFEILAASTGKLVNTVELPAELKEENILVSRDGRRIYVDCRLNGSYRRSGSLIVIDCETGKIVSTHESLEGGAWTPTIERADGVLVLKTIRFEEGKGITGSGVTLLDPDKGVVSEEMIDDMQGMGGLHCPSPDGSLWLRPDKTHLPMRVATRNGVPTRLFGYTMQVWQAFPLKPVRRIVVAWRALRELPFIGNDDPDPERSNYGVAYKVLSETIERAQLSPTDALKREYFPEPYRSNDKAWHYPREAMSSLFSPIRLRAAWEPGGTAFWLDFYPGMFVRVDIEGAVSPMMMLSPARRQQAQIRNVPEKIIGLPGGRARLEFKHGAAIIAEPEGKHDLFNVLTLSEHQDGWIPPNLEAKAKHNALADEAIRDDEGLKVPLASWSEADCIAAIDALIAYVEPDLVHRKVENDLRAEFVMGDEIIGEDVFFERAAREHPEAAAAIARLIDRYCDVFGGKHPYIYWKGEEGVWFLGHAVRALAAKGMAHMKTVRRYGLEVDAEHELFFWNAVSQAMLKALGEGSREAIDFLIYILIRQLYNSADTIDVWEKHVHKAAKAAFGPEAFAQHVLDQAKLYERQEDFHYSAYNRGREGHEEHGYGAPVLDRLATYYEKRYRRRDADEWEQRVFAEWRRVCAIFGPTYL